MRIRADSKKALPGDFSAHFLIDPDTGLYVQDFFQERLYLERRRTERSGKPFLLMLVGIESIAKARGGEILQQIAHALIILTREIDLKGWYRNGSSIGVIFTEMEQTGEAVCNGILQKIFVRLNRSLTLEELKLLDITFHTFPEEEGEKKRAESGLTPPCIRS
jgi:hypothetical protein